MKICQVLKINFKNSFQKISNLDMQSGTMLSSGLTNIAPNNSMGAKGLAGNICSLGTNMACSFGSTITSSSLKHNNEIVTRVLISRDLSRQGFDEVVLCNYSIILL